MANRKLKLLALDRKPRPGASVFALSGGPMDSKLGDIDYLCGHYGIPVIVNHPANVGFAGAGGECAIRCGACRKQSIAPGRADGKA